MSNDDNAPIPRPEYDALVADLRAAGRREREATIAKAEQARRNGVEVMRKAALAFGEGRISAIELTRLHALKMRLDATLPLPGETP